jgi:hypothetical protein
MPRSLSELIELSAEKTFFIKGHRVLHSFTLFVCVIAPTITSQPYNVMGSGFIRSLTTTLSSRA